ncbi:MAG: transcription termination/antitermination protein NusG [Atribacterota bacterium]|uniref:transcription termination/antitermination protein NusG n=1 Tax=Candidatus Caldatribacterium sp. TaxID=2282143 RepID=UPI002995926F|nr:transcription termination/antitermination protein NusG [Candidatus Caldatribacterium sp.]MCX7729865.1 transcription termination/antitermination protein NusG [Candidatus Caldatribacterium sp.]MDW8082052.1 transcription termination/antitermination protein NusG [Candidatus Calescibacterium sp.]
MQPRWYVIHTLAGSEHKVKANLERRIASMGMQDQIFRVVVPMEETIEVRRGKKRFTKRKIFPGYVMVEMIMNDRSWYVVRNTPGVTGFVGSGMRPEPLSDEEVKVILRQTGIEKKPRLDIEKGEVVKVISGPFLNYTGTVESVDHEKGKVTVLLSIFGRETPVELEFSDVEKL